MAIVVGREKPIVPLLYSIDRKEGGERAWRPWDLGLGQKQGNVNSLFDGCLESNLSQRQSAQSCRIFSRRIARVISQLRLPLTVLGRLIMGLLYGL